MSLRSASPCTRTSIPAFSWKAMTSAISAAMRSSYPAASIRPARRSARAARTSPVCGNEPMVVVGSRGSRSRSRWATARSGYGWGRRASASVTAAVLARTAGSRVSGESAREARAARLAAISAPIAPVPSASPLARVTISAVFCRAKASQRRICGSSSRSGAVSSGTCSREQEAATSTRPARPSRVARVASDFSWSLIQMLRPLTTPATSRLPGRPPTAARSSRLAAAASVKSSASPSTGALASTGSASPSRSKYEATSSLGRSVRAPRSR